jgi:hypothetical protein
MNPILDSDVLLQCVNVSLLTLEHNGYTVGIVQMKIHRYGQFTAASLGTCEDLQLELLSFCLGVYHDCKVSCTCRDFPQSFIYYELSSIDRFKLCAPLTGDGSNLTTEMQ